jgi:hypothetical protein
MQMIGLGTERDGLYYFTTTRPARCQVAKSTSQLWHRRLGHLSNKVLSFLSNNVSDICSSDSDFALWLSKHVFLFQLVKFLPLHLLNYYTLTFGVVIAHLPLMGHVIFLLLLMTTPDVHGSI